MSRIIIDETLPNKLLTLMHPAELVDGTGNVVGRYVPDLSRYENLEPQISEEELERRYKQGGGRTLAEILADLEKRG